MSQTQTQSKPIVDPILFSLVPRPSAEQREALRESIIKDGQLEPIVCDEQMRIIDGFTRHEICQELGVVTKYVIKHFQSDLDTRHYAITTNLKRRHLNDLQIYELFEKDIEMIKKQNVSVGSKKIWAARKGVAPIMTYEEKVLASTQHKAVELTGLGAGVVENIMYVKKNADKKIIDDIRDGKTSVHSAALKLRKTISNRADTGRNYRSLLGVTYDILTVLINTKDEVRIVHISAGTRLNSDYANSVVNDLVKSNIIKKHNKRYLTKYYNRETNYTYFTLTNKGKLLYKKYLALYKHLPKEWSNK